MRTRAVVAAVTGSAAAAAGHALDASGRLPFVHEAGGVRLAMGPGAVLLWLLVAALLAALAAATQPILVGAPAAVAVSAAPEIWGRGDLGAIGEPGALLGGLLQLLLVLLVVAVAVAFQRLPTGRAPTWLPSRHEVAARRARSTLIGFHVGSDARPRAPPQPALPAS